ncbi:MAG: hypothetical protein AAF657_18515, partial [Acidobacteriota bacterium]
VERRLNPNSDLRVSWIRRDWRDLWDDRFLVTSQRSAENLPEAERWHEELRVLFQKRFADRWQMLASYTWSKTEGNLFANTGRSSFADLSDLTDTNLVNRFGPAPYDRPHQIKIFAQVQEPLTWATVSIGNAVRFQSGTPYQQEFADGFGLRFLTPRGALRLENFWQWDLSAGLSWQWRSQAELEAKLEVFNLTDEQAQLGVETRIEGGRFGLPRSIADLQGPRQIRLTLGLRF